MEPLPAAAPRPAGSPARIADVAALAGVGIATVSRVLNGHVGVRPSQRAGSPCGLRDAVRSCSPGMAVDAVAGGGIATRHLLGLGHRRVALIGDPPPEFRFGWGRDRTRGYERALAAAGIEVRDEYVREGTRLPQVARAIAAELLSLPERPTAVFAASDTQAIGVLEAARTLGIDVPGDLSVIGFDD